MMRILLFFLISPVVMLLPFSREGKQARAYDAPRTSHPIIIDGALDDVGWAAAPWTGDFVDILGVDAPTPPLRTQAKLLWDDAYLYVAARIEEPHLWATLSDRDAIIYRDDDFEVFLDPDGDGLDYFEFEVNALGTVLDLFLEKPYGRGGRARIDWDAPGLEVHASLSGTLNDPSDMDEGWSVEMAIPWADLVPPGQGIGDPSTEALPDSWRPGQPPRVGDTWRVNFSRVDWPLEVLRGSYRKTATPTRANPHPENNWVWSPHGAINMHLPEFWGSVRFVSTLPAPAPARNDSGNTPQGPRPAPPRRPGDSPRYPGHP